ncbi:hypothetical protein KKI24_12520 [bacterium]|nr:hypothetical protein [bacterium]
MWDWLKSNLFSFYKNLKTYSYERLPILCPLDESTILNRDGTFTKVIQVTGIDYNGRSAEALEKFATIRASLFMRSTGLLISYYVLRFKQAATLDSAEFDNAVTQSIFDSWSASFDNVFLTRHFLAISTKGNILGALSKIKTKAQKKPKNSGNGSEREAEQASLTRLNEFTDFIATTLSDYQAKILKGDELNAFFASLVNCTPYHSVSSVTDTYNHWIVSNPVRFTEFKRTFEYISSGKLSSFLTVKNFPEFAVQQFFDAIIQQNIEMIITHHCDLLDQDASIGQTQDKLRVFENFGKFNQLLIRPTVELLNRLQANDVRLAQHTLSIQIVSDDTKSHKQNLNQISKLLTQNGYLTSTEILNNEPLYFSQFPSTRSSNVRKKRLTTDNLVDFISFSTSGTGNQRCSFGPSPTAQFASVDGNIFNFVFHISEATNALGHTLIIGDTGSGKTTLISFLLTCARRHKGMKIVAFDQLRGQEIATRMQYGNYINFSDSSFAINPLLLPPTTQSKTFIVDFLSNMIDATEDEKIRIEKNIDTIFGWDLKTRNLDEITYLLTQKGEKLYDKLSMWQTGGVYEGYFNGKSNSVSFENLLTTFDFTHIISEPKILGLMTSYLSHVFFSESDGSPRIIFIDELRRYLESDIFSQIIQRFLQEFRKLNGVFVGAVQNIDQLWDSKVGKREVGNFGKFIIFPISGNINKEAYMEGVGLNERELDWLKNADVHDRQVLIKTKGGASTIVNVNLKFLGKYIKVFDSSSQNVAALNRLMADHPSDFRQRFLNT